MRISIYTGFSLLFLCCSSAYKKPVATHRTKCKIISQDVSIDSSILRNVYDIYEDFTQSSNKVDLLKIAIREEGRRNTAKRIYMLAADTTKLFFYNSNNPGKVEQIRSKEKINKISSLKSIRHGRYTFFCLNELPNEMNLYIIKDKNVVSYKLMISEGNEQNAVSEEATLAPLFELLNE